MVFIEFPVFGLSNLKIERTNSSFFFIWSIHLAALRLCCLGQPHYSPFPPQHPTPVFPDIIPGRNFLD